MTGNERPVGPPAPDAGDDHRVLDDRARALAAPLQTDDVATELHLVLRVGDHRLGVAAARARHVAGPRPLTAVSSAPSAIVGMAPVLGELVAVADLAALVGAVSQVPHDQRHIVVVDDGGEGLGLLVDAVEELVDVDLRSGDADSHVLGALTGASVGDLRLLSLDAALADPRLAHPDGSPADSAKGSP